MYTTATHFETLAWRVFKKEKGAADKQKWASSLLLRRICTRHEVDFSSWAWSLMGLWASEPNLGIPDTNAFAKNQRSCWNFIAHFIIYHFLVKKLDMVFCFFASCKEDGDGWWWCPFRLLLPLTLLLLPLPWPLLWGEWIMLLVARCCRSCLSCCFNCACNSKARW